MFSYNMDISWNYPCSEFSRRRKILIFPLEEQNWLRWFYGQNNTGEDKFSWFIFLMLLIECLTHWEAGFVGSSGNWSSCCLECRDEGTLVTQVLHVPSMWVNSCQSLLVGAWHGFVRTFVTRCAVPLSINKYVSKECLCRFEHLRCLPSWRFAFFLMPVFSWYDEFVFGPYVFFSHLLSLFRFEKCLPT